MSMRISSSARRLSLLSCAFFVGSCAYATKASFQEITFLSPDARDAKCLVYASGVKYQVWPPQTVNIKKSDKPMRVLCHAPGNRDIEVEVPPRMETVAVWGTPVGMAWDYASQSLFSYPEVIAIDFSQESLKPFSLPKHNNQDIRQPESYDLEEFLPGDPRLNRDKNKKDTLLLRRGEGADEWADDEETEMPSEDEQSDAVEAVGEAEDVTTEVVGQEASIGASVEETFEFTVEAEAIQVQEAPAVDSVLTPIVESSDPAAEVPTQNSEADNAPVPLVPGE
jgi:hypothetical protein